MLTRNHQWSANYRDNIIHYNACLAFASRQATHEQLPSRGAYCMRVHGQVHHRIGGLRPANGGPRKYAMLYILDAQQALEQLMAIVYTDNVIRGEINRHYQNELIISNN